MTANFDRTKYNFEYYFYSPHHLAANRVHKATRDHPDDPRVNYIYLISRWIGGLNYTVIHQERNT